MEKELEEKFGENRIWEEAVRLECLRLARFSDAFPEKMIAIADALERYVREGRNGFCLEEGMSLEKAVENMIKRA